MNTIRMLIWIRSKNRRKKLNSFPISKGLHTPQLHTTMKSQVVKIIMITHFFNWFGDGTLVEVKIHKLCIRYTELYSENKKYLF